MAKPVSVLLLALCICVFSAEARSISDKFYGFFKFVNCTIYANGNWIPRWNNNPQGSIVYIPNHPGALYGNMTVEFGQAVDWSTSPTPADILSNITAYSGGYILDLDNARIGHVPVISTAASVPQGQANYRYYFWSDYDNLLRLYVPNVADLYWSRVLELPRVNVEASVAPQGSSWVESGVAKQNYQFSIHNGGSTVVSSLSIWVTGTIYSTWGLTQVGTTNEYQVSLYGGLAAGGTVNPGMIASGSVTVSVASAESN